MNEVAKEFCTPCMLLRMILNKAYLRCKMAGGLRIDENVGIQKGNNSCRMTVSRNIGRGFFVDPFFHALVFFLVSVFSVAANTVTRSTSALSEATQRLQTL